MSSLAPPEPSVYVKVAPQEETPERVSALLRERLAEWAYPNAKLIGPAPAPLERLRGRYRWHVIVQAPDPAVVLDNMPFPDGWVVDIDPMSMT